MTAADTQKYVNHINNLKKYLESRLDSTMETCDWMINPITAKADEACQEELFEIRHDEESKTNFDSGGNVQLWQNQKVNKNFISKHVENNFKFADHFSYFIPCRSGFQCCKSNS